MKENKIEKIAVLGGGISSISAVWKLTNDPDWQSKYDITLYQMGWRIGGKGASGRNPAFSNRIEEHGLHLWFGCYHNSFYFMDECYKELNREVGSSVYNLREAFLPARYVALHEEMGENEENWLLDFHFNHKQPGAQKEIPSVWENLVRMVKIMVRQYLEGIATYTFEKNVHAPKEERDFYRKLNKDFMDHFRKYGKVMGLQINDLSPDEMVEIVEEFFYYQKINEKYDVLLYIIEENRNWLWENIRHKVNKYPDLRRMWTLFDFTMSTIVGVIKDDLHNKGLDVINHLDFREWLSQYSKTPEITAWSAPIQAMYSLIFCGKRMHTFEAGTCLRCIFRVTLDYNGAFYYRMQGGMGDIVFTPAYEVLKKRGVKFRFFHKVENLGLSEDKTHVNTIRIGRQATLKGDDYDPFVRVKGLNCWPSIPNYDQLVEGEALRSGNIDLEAQWNQWENIETIDLQHGKDFDKVILGISIGALPYVAKELIDASPDWQNMVREVQTTPTQALQIWLKPDINGLGWEHGKYGMPLVGNFKGTFDTWADLSNILRREAWNGESNPGNLAYLCGKLDATPLTPDSSPDHHRKELARVQERVDQFLEDYSTSIWPDAHENEGNRFNYSTLIGEQTRCENNEAIYFRANLEPTEQYVLAEKNTSQFRLKAEASGYQNVVITGDWINNGWNAGCIEATVISGLQAARAISGESYRIIGETDVTEIPKDKIKTYKTTRRLIYNSEVLIKIKKLFKVSNPIFVRN